MAAQPATDQLRETLRTPRAAAVSGIVFSALLIAALALLTLSTPSRIGSSGAWLASSGRRQALSWALALVPFAGIAFLWFIGVVRDRLGQLEDRFFATVFLGSGLLFIGMLFVAAAIGGALLADLGAHPSATRGTATIAEGRQLSSILLRTYALRMAGVFTMSTATILLRTRVAPRWIAWLGLAVALVLLFAVGVSPWLQLVFPAWIGLLSIAILLWSVRTHAAAVVPSAG